MIQMLRKESCSGQIEDLARVSSADCLPDCLTKSSAKSDALYKTVSTMILPNIDMPPPFRSLLKHMAYLSRWLRSILGHQAPFLSFFEEIPLSVICLACLALQSSMSPQAIDGQTPPLTLSLVPRERTRESPGAGSSSGP